MSEPVEKIAERMCNSINKIDESLKKIEKINQSYSEPISSVCRYCGGQYVLFCDCVFEANKED